jgi:hypothetical protein
MPDFSAAQPSILTGLSTDTKPTNYPIGTIFIETDFRNIYVWDGSAWGSIYNIRNTIGGVVTTFENQFQQFYPGKFLFADSTASFNYIFNPVGSLTASRLLNLPVLPADDTVVFQNLTQTLANKTLPFLNVVTPAGSSNWESVASFGVSDSVDTFTIDNAFSDNTVFVPIIRSTITSGPTNAFHYAMYFQGIVKDTTDSVADSIVIFAAQKSSGAIANRSLYAFRNYTTDLITVYPAYTDFNNNSIRNAAIKSTENTLTGVVQEPLLKRTGLAQPQSSNLTTGVGIVVLDGILTGHTATGAGTNTNTWDTTEGLLSNWISTTTAGANLGLVSPAAGVGITRRAFATRARIRSKVDTVAGSVSRFYFGFSTVAAPVVSDSPVANSAEAVIVGYGAADTNWQVWTHAGSGAATKTQFTGPIAKDTGFHTVEISWTAAGNPVVKIDATSQTFSTDIPATTTNLFFNAVAQNATAAIRTHSVKGVWLEIG